MLVLGTYFLRPQGYSGAGTRTRTRRFSVQEVGRVYSYRIYLTQLWTRPSQGLDLTSHSKVIHDPQARPPPGKKYLPYT